MAIYHCSLKIISRGKGQSAVSSSAYRAGEKLTNYETGEIIDYTRKQGVIFNEILLPENAPEEYKDREKLWNSVQKIEKSGNARLAREVEVALPAELSRKTQIEIIQRYVQDAFVNRGMCADVALHDKGDGNPHAHIMLTTRSLKKDGDWAPKSKKVYHLDDKGNKIIKKRDRNNRIQYDCHTEAYNDWNNRENAEVWRKAWADICNQYLDLEQQIDHRSYKRQGVEQIPTIHEGYVARQMEQHGELSDRREVNREIRKENQEISRINNQIQSLSERSKKNLDKIGQIPYKPDPIKRKELIEKELEQAWEKVRETDGIIEQLKREKIEAEKKQRLEWNEEMFDQAKIYFSYTNTAIFQEYQNAPRFGKRSKKNLLNKEKNPESYIINHALNIERWFEKNEIPIPDETQIQEVLEARADLQSIEEKLNEQERINLDFYQKACWMEDQLRECELPDIEESELQLEDQEELESQPEFTVFSKQNLTERFRQEAERTRQLERELELEQDFDLDL